MSHIILMTKINQCYCCHRYVVTHRIIVIILLYNDSMPDA